MKSSEIVRSESTPDGPKHEWLTLPPRSDTAGETAVAAIVTTETTHTPIAQQSCDRVSIDFQWLL